MNFLLLLACLPVGFQLYTSLCSLDSPLVAHIVEGHATQLGNIQVNIAVSSAGNTVHADVTAVPKAVLRLQHLRGDDRS